MDESAIAAKLQALIPKPEVVAPAIVQATQEAHKEELGISPTTNDLGAFKLMDFFAVPQNQRNEREVMDMITYIHTWGEQQASSDDSVDVMTVIRQLEGQLGLTFRQDEKLKSIYRYIKLDNERRRVEKEMALV